MPNCHGECIDIAPGEGTWPLFLRVLLVVIKTENCGDLMPSFSMFEGIWRSYLHAMMNASLMHSHFY